jgi:hypothetical protein
LEAVPSENDLGTVERKGKEKMNSKRRMKEEQSGLELVSLMVKFRAKIQP